MVNIIVTVHDFISSTGGGGDLRAMKTALEFKKRGHNVSIWAPSDSSVINGMKVEKLKRLSKNNLILGSLAYNWSLFLKLMKNRKNIDIIFVQNAVGGILCTLFGKIFRKKVVYGVCDILTEYMLIEKKSFFKKNLILLLRKMEYWSFKNADTLITISKFMKDLIRRKTGRNDIYIVYDGAEAFNFSPEKEKHKNINIIHHGSVDIQDGVYYIPLAAKKVLEKYPKIKFYIVGAGSQLDYVKKIAEEQGVSNSFVFCGWRPYNEMKKYLKKADIGLITRPNIPANNTVLTLKLMEYWASATAPVIPRLKAMMEVAEDKEDVLFFEPDNSEDLADKIIYLLKNKSLIKKIQKKGRKKIIEKFDWNYLASKIADIALK